MNATVNGSAILVTLSESNLKTLLSKVQREGSKRTITRRTEGGHYLCVVAQPDDEHYAGRERGRVHPIEEAKL